jgi:hypothetical protein
MTNKTLDSWAKAIESGVAYREGKDACANLISDIAKKKLGDKWTKKRETNFRKKCGL